MRKKTTKKLTLAKETVRNLEAGELVKVAGGLSAADTTCGSGIYSCGSCGGGKTTGTRLC